MRDSWRIAAAKEEAPDEDAQLDFVIADFLAESCTHDAAIESEFRALKEDATQHIVKHIAKHAWDAATMKDQAHGPQTKRKGQRKAQGKEAG